MTAKVPRDKTNDYSKISAEERRVFAHEQTKGELNYVGQFSFVSAIAQK